MRQRLLLLAACALLCSLRSINLLGETLFTDGYISRVSASGEFDFNGFHVVVTKKTALLTQTGSNPRTSVPVTDIPELYVGRPVEIEGDLDRAGGQIKAKHVLFLTLPSNHVEGTGIVDLLPTASDPAAGRLVRADGYLLLIPNSAAVTFSAPLTGLGDIRTNLWVRYRGAQRPDGVVAVEQAEFSVNNVNHREDHLRAHTDYDPALIDQGDAQGGASKFFRGTNPERLPAWHDAAMQARVERIGASLVPAFQKALSEDDPTRIDFRFQVTDEPKHGDAWSLPSGIILVPHQVVERLPEDSQLAAILADSIAEALEKQTLREIPAAHKMAAASIAGGAAGFFVPGLGLAATAANYKAASVILHHSQQQSGRVSLCLLHDAGYDINQAPLAWMAVSTKASTDPLPKRLPDHSSYLYGYLGTTWHSSPGTAARHW